MNPSDDNKNKAAENKTGDEQFPLYPHYPAGEDVYSKNNPGKKVDADVDKITRKTHITRDDLQTGNKTEVDSAPLEGEDLGLVSGNDADVTADDLLGLEAIDREMNDEDNLDGAALDSINEADDVAAQTLDWKNDKTGSDLDIPGDDLDDEGENMGAEDEENNGYSIGGDRQDSLEEDREDDGN